MSRDFDFLGYAFTPGGLDAAPATIERCIEWVSRLDEQKAPNGDVPITPAMKIRTIRIPARRASEGNWPGPSLARRAGM